MRSIVYIALIASVFASSCKGTLRNTEFDLTPLRNEMQDYRTQLYAPNRELNRTYVRDVALTV